MNRPTGRNQMQIVKPRRNHPGRLLLPILSICFLIIANCGGGGGDGNSDSSPTPPSANVTGTWDANMIVTGGNRLPIGFVVIAVMNLDQSGSNISGTIENLYDIEPKVPIGNLTGTISGDELTITIEQGSGCMGTFSINAWMSGTNDSMSGDYSGEDCHGTMQAMFLATPRVI